MFRNLPRSTCEINSPLHRLCSPSSIFGSLNPKLLKNIKGKWVGSCTTCILKASSFSKDILQYADTYDHTTRVYFYWGICVSNSRKYVHNAGVRPLLIGLSPGYGFAGVLQVTYMCAFLIGGAGLSTLNAWPLIGNLLTSEIILMPPSRSQMLKSHFPTKIFHTLYVLTCIREIFKSRYLFGTVPI